MVTLAVRVVPMSADAVKRVSGEVEVIVVQSRQPLEIPTQVEGRRLHGWIIRV